MKRAARFEEQRLSGNPRRSAAGPKALVYRKIRSLETGPSIQTSGMLGFWMEGNNMAECELVRRKSDGLWRTVTRDGINPCPKHGNRVTMRCNECGKKRKVSADGNYNERCPNCSGVDWDVVAETQQTVA